MVVRRPGVPLHPRRVHEGSVKDTRLLPLRLQAGFVYVLEQVRGLSIPVNGKSVVWFHPGTVV